MNDERREDEGMTEFTMRRIRNEIIEECVKAVEQYGLRCDRAGAIVGLLVASMDQVNFNLRGKPVRWPRLYAGAAAAVLWPLVVWKLVVGR